MSLEDAIDASWVPARVTAQQLNDHIHIDKVQLVGSAQLSLRFDIQWQDSWRTSPGAGPQNWDAAWIYVKMCSTAMTEKGERIFDYDLGEWGPAYFSTTPEDHSGPANAVIDPAEDELGVFICRGEPGVGPIAFQGVEIALAKSTSNWCKQCQQLSIAVFAEPMVYIPEGSFWLGDPAGPNGPTNCFYDPQATDDNKAYQVTSEDEIEVGSEAQLYYTSDGFGGDQQGPIPADFPKGYQAFYMMRNPVTQSQYARFVNLIGSVAKTERFPYMGQGAYRFTIHTDRQGMRIATRGQRPCNFLAWADGAAFASWAGLRPMTELEFTKAARGFADPVSGEYAWGGTDIEYAQVIVGNEGGQSVVSGNCNTNNTYVEFDGGDGGQGPVRADTFLMAGSPSTVSFFTAQAHRVLDDDEKKSEALRALRLESGASYFNVMGLSGNLWEYCVTPGDRKGRKFTGKNGDGRLDALGNADFRELGWPGIDVRGVGYRGGSWYTVASSCRVANRASGGGFPAYTFRSHDTGMRCVRTAPKTSSGS